MKRTVARWFFTSLGVLVANLGLTMRAIVYNGVFETNRRLLESSDFIEVNTDSGVTLASGVTHSYETYATEGAWVSPDGITAVVGVPLTELLGRGLWMAAVAGILSAVLIVMWRRVTLPCARWAGAINVLMGVGSVFTVTSVGMWTGTIIGSQWAVAGITLVLLVGIAVNIVRDVNKEKPA